MSVFPSEPRWLAPADVISINRREVAETRESFFLRDEGALESAVRKPRNLWYYEGEDDVAVLASAFLFGIARNHPFEQGNKRTGFTAALVFLQLNGYEVTLEDDESLADIIVDVITRKLSEDDFHVFLAAGVQPSKSR